MSEMLTQAEMQAIRERAAAATPGPWYWTGNIKAKQFALVAKTYLYPIVMGFVRWGNLWGIPQFRNAERDVMVEAFDLINTPDHNNKFEGINHPDAAFIAHSREDVDNLLFTVERYREALERIAHPMAYLQAEAERLGYELDMPMAILLVNMPSWYREEANTAITAEKRQE